MRASHVDEPVVVEVPVRYPASGLVIERLQVEHQSFAAATGSPSAARRNARAPGAGPRSSARAEGRGWSQASRAACQREREPAATQRGTSASGRSRMRSEILPVEVELRGRDEQRV